MTFPLWLTDLCWHSLIFFLFTVLGYFATAGSLYGFLYLRRSSRFAIEADNWAIATIWAAIRSDVILSVLSSGIFAICAALMTTAYTLGITRLYLQPRQYGFWYLGFSLVLVLVLQDAYFYFTHRLSHHPKCYRWLHQGHHHSKDPTPWTAFAFDPAEAMIQSIYLIGVTLIIPMHLSVLVAVVMVMSMGAMVHHFGVRLFEDSAFGKWLGSWMVGTTHHWLHHRKFTVHYSLYFTFWDRLLGTQYKGYETVLIARKSLVKADRQATPETAITGSVVETLVVSSPLLEPPKSVLR
ncbi:MAG: sterol desaturase family protein [Phormidesmis sp.]